MIKVIDGKRYNTETAELIFTRWNGYPRSDFKFRAKQLFRTKNGAWFMFHEGGAMSDMATSHGNSRGWGEDIEPVNDDDAYGFLESHSDEKQASEAIEKYFSDRIVDA